MLSYDKDLYKKSGNEIVRVWENSGQKINFPLAAPSANIFTRISAVTASDVNEEFKGKVNNKKDKLKALRNRV